MKTTCLICNAVIPPLAHRCHNCGTVNGSGASASSPSSEMDHLAQVNSDLRKKMFAVVEESEDLKRKFQQAIRERDALANYIDGIAEDADGCGDEILAKQMRRFVADTISENAEPIHGAKDSD